MNNRIAQQIDKQNIYDRPIDRLVAGLPMTELSILAERHEKSHGGMH